jgi:hypothetical protein
MRVKKKEIELVPNITDILTSALGSGSTNFPRKQFLNYLTVSSDPAALDFLKCYRELKSDADRVPIEAICIYAKVNPVQLLGSIMLSAKEMKGKESALKAIVAHPDIVQSTINSAKLLGPNGASDRKVLHEAIGFLPTKNGAQFSINLFGGGVSSGKIEDDDDEASDAALDRAFPMITGSIEKWGNDRKNLLGDAKCIAKK